MPDSKHPGLEDDPVSPEFDAKMEALARGIDKFLNGDAQPSPNGFVLLTFPFAGFESGGESRVNYISNAPERADIVGLFRELIGRWEAQKPKGTG